jgi:hypothetical protein
MTTNDVTLLGARQADTAKPARIAAGLGLFLALPAWALCALLALIDAYEGRGIAGPLVGAGFGAVLASGAAGLTALLTWSGPARRAAVWAQYALLLLAPVLVAMDPNS